MITITALVRAKKGEAETMKNGLLMVAENVAKNEPDTIGFFISQSEEEPELFATYERFTDKAAMDRHNNSETVAAFFEIAKPILAEPATVLSMTEISKK